jgi:hypothetical protein
MVQAGDGSQWIVDQKIAIGGSSAASAAFNAKTQYVLLSSDVVCSVSWAQPGATPTAAASNLRIPANGPVASPPDPGSLRTPPSRRLLSQRRRGDSVGMPRY